LALAAVTVVAGLVLAAVSAGLSPAPAQAKTTWELNEELSQTKERLQQAQKSIQEAEVARLAAARDVAGLDRTIELLQEKLTASTEVRDVAAAKLAQSRKALDTVTAELTKKRTQFDKAESDLARANAGLEARAVGIYKAGRMGYVLMLLENSDLSDLMTRVDFLTMIMNQDIKIAEEIRLLQGRVIEEGRALEQKVAEVAAVEQQQRTETSALDKVVAERAQAVKEVSDARAVKQALVAKAESNKETWLEKARQLEDESAGIQAELRGSSGGSVSGSGQMIWPVDGVITSPFGERENPIFHTIERHSGIDLGAGEGTPICAADSGTVTLAGVKGGYGKCIIISHGNGLATLYGHQSKLLVSEGQAVRQGQVIGLVGSTGWSTGPHLHFEVRLDGECVNPMKYL
jgi:murein DD-endopeptidase MepM/ murein hydrolase activator NlpD